VIDIITSKDKPQMVLFMQLSQSIFLNCWMRSKVNDTHNIKIPNNSGLKGLDRPQQVKDGRVRLYGSGQLN
jgi:hypothetical protein